MTDIQLPENIKTLIGQVGKFTSSEALSNASPAEHWAHFEVTRGDLSAYASGPFSDHPEYLSEAIAETGGHALYLLTSVFGVRNGDALIGVMKEQANVSGRDSAANWNLALSAHIGRAAEALNYRDNQRVVSSLMRVTALCANWLDSLERGGAA